MLKCVVQILKKYLLSETDRKNMRIFKYLASKTNFSKEFNIYIFTIFDYKNEIIYFFSSKYFHKIKKIFKLNKNINYKLILNNYILYFFLLTIPSIFHIDLKSQDNLPSIYLGTIEIGNVDDKEREVRIRNSISKTMVSRYKNKFRLIDDETVKNLMARLKIQQQMGCSTEKCERMIDDAINADYKITGRLTREEDDKFRLILKKFRFQNYESTMENTVEKVFSKKYLEYYARQLSIQLIEPRYEIIEKEGESEKVGIDYPFFHFPGYPQRDIEIAEWGEEEPAGLMTNTLIYGSYSALAITGIGMVAYQATYSSYKNTSGLNPFFYYFFSENSNGLGLLLMNQDQAKYSSAYSRVESSAGVVNGGLGLFGVMVLLSHLDLLTTTKSADNVGFNGIPLFRLDRGAIGINARREPPLSSGSTYRPPDMQYTMEFNYQF